MKIIGPELNEAAACEAVLRSLPQWFGIEDALQMYARDSARLPTFAVVDDGAIVGFLALRQHFAAAWEVHCVAVRAEARNRGLGRALFAHSEAWLLQRGARVLQVKTIAEARPDPNYAQTRAFYARLGFEPLEVFPELWHPRNPCLQLVKWLDAARA